MLAAPAQRLFTSHDVTGPRERAYPIASKLTVFMQVPIAIHLEQFPRFYILVALALTPHILTHMIKKTVSICSVVMLKRFRNHVAECGVELNTCEQIGNTSVASDHDTPHSTNQLPDNIIIALQDGLCKTTTQSTHCWLPT